MRTSEQIRSDVSKAYARAIQGGGGCCGGGAGGGARALPAGYETGDVAGLPEGATGSSHGCGNPLAFADVKDGDVVLDLGAGAGLDLLVAAKRVGARGRVIGVDMTDAMIEAARRNIAEAGVDNVEVRKGIIEKLPVEDASVDWVISNCVINLSPEKDRVFAEIRRVLKPGGRVRVSDIVVEGLPEALRDNVALYSACVAGAVSEEEYVAGLRRAGLADVEVVDRLVYEKEALRAIAEEELGACGCTAGLLDFAVGAMTGKVWSAAFTARRP
jgi:SAM-dependent methyltransferase